MLGEILTSGLNMLKVKFLFWGEYDISNSLAVPSVVIFVVALVVASASDVNSVFYKLIHGDCPMKLKTFI